MSEFSGALQLTGLDDWITPSQECIKPLLMETEEKNVKKGTILIDDDGSYSELKDGLTKTLDKATITLNDCLACSGCITTAESILITAQSIEEFEESLNSGKKIVVSISPQSRTSLAVYYDLTDVQLFKQLINFFQSIGIDYVFDTSFASEIAVQEVAKEFVERKRKSIQTNENQNENKNENQNEEDEQYFPLLTSSCPGWICYAEKTHGDYILPYISTTKSPQQIMGSIVKQYFKKKLKINEKNNENCDNDEDIYHVTIMPCWDKKLEASRDDFMDQINSTKDVDCVLSTDELKKFIDTHQNQSNHFWNITNTHNNNNQHNNNEDCNDIILDLTRNTWNLAFNNICSIDSELKFYGSVFEGNGSGGVLEYVFKYAAKELFNVTVDSLEYNCVRKNNKDLQTLSLEISGNTVLNFVLAYGFKNIQNIVQNIPNPNKIQKGRKVNSTRLKKKYDFVEIMACPSGCLNGGAQINPKNNQNVIDLLQDVKNVWKNNQNQNQNIQNLNFEKKKEENLIISKLFEDFINNSNESKQFLHTQYHAVKKLQNPLAIKW